jgi:hypothetical protein
MAFVSYLLNPIIMLHNVLLVVHYFKLIYVLFLTFIFWGDMSLSTSFVSLERFEFVKV